MLENMLTRVLSWYNIDKNVLTELKYGPQQSIYIIFNYRQSPPPHVTQMSSGVSASAASVTQPASKTGSSDSDSTLSNSKKRMLDEADQNLAGSMSSNKRQR
jgi:hypothetical protein